MESKSNFAIEKLKKFCKDNHVKMRYVSNDNGVVTEYDSEKDDINDDEAVVDTKKESNFTKEEFESALDKLIDGLDDNNAFTDSFSREEWDTIRKNFTKAIGIDPDEYKSIIGSVGHPVKHETYEKPIVKVEDEEVNIPTIPMPPTSVEGILEEMLDTYNKKNSDYGSTTVKLYKKYGLDYYRIMLEQKLNRLDSLANKASANYESVEDTLLDLANYAVLAVQSLREEKYWHK